MSRVTRKQILDRIEVNPLARMAPLADSGGGPASLPWEELGLVVQGLALGQRPIRAAAAGVTKRFGLGPRGAYILSLISGGVVYPNELALALKIGRSLITAELTRLTDAGLIRAEPGETDRRRSQLSLTPDGEAACDEVRLAMRGFVTRNLAGYSVDEIRLFIRMLRDVRRLEPGEEDLE